MRFTWEQRSIRFRLLSFYFDKLSPNHGRNFGLALTPEQQRQKTLITLLSLVLELAAQHPVPFIVEDLHWIDPSTPEFLERLVDQSPTAALLTVVTCRPTV